MDITTLIQIGTVLGMGIGFGTVLVKVGHVLMQIGQLLERIEGHHRRLEAHERRIADLERGRPRREAPA